MNVWNKNLIVVAVVYLIHCSLSRSANICSSFVRITLFEMSDNRIIVFANKTILRTLRNDFTREFQSPPLIFTSWLPRNLFAIKEYIEPLVFAFGITITSSQCTFHVMEAISASSLKRLQNKRQHYHRQRRGCYSAEAY